MKTQYSPKQVAEELNLKYMQVMRRIRSGKIVATKVGWGWIIEEQELKRLREVKNGTNKICA